MLFDARAQLRIHVLDRADPDAHHPGAQVTEILPGERVGPERIGGCRWDDNHLGLLRLTALTINSDNARCLEFRRARRWTLSSRNFCVTARRVIWAQTFPANCARGDPAVGRGGRRAGVKNLCETFENALSQTFADCYVTLWSPACSPVCAVNDSTREA